MTTIKQMKQWVCRNNHILGFIRWDQNGVAQLMVLRMPLDMEAESPNDVDLLGPLDGRMSIRCLICADVKIWKSRKRLLTLSARKRKYLSALRDMAVSDV